MSFRASNSPIVHGFQAFYYELLRQKELCLSKFFSKENSSADPNVIEDSEMIQSGGSPSELEGLIVSVQKKLLSTLDKVFEIISAKTRLSPRKLEETKYIMIVLADEIFINMNWDGAKFWRFSLLEKQTFQSEVSGEKFFTLLDEHIEEIHSINEEIAFLYLMSLSLGFKGRYKGAENANEYISWYKDKLYSMLHKKPSRLFYPGRANMIENCYEYTVTEENRQTLPDTHFWTIVITGVIVIYIIISYIVWFGITDDVSDVLNAISEQIRRGPLI